MSIPVPLGVRVYQTVYPLDQYITKLVDDFTFRNVIPGGFASLTLKFRLPTTEYEPDTVISQGVAFQDSGAPNYIVVPDAQVGATQIGDRGWVYTDSTLSSIRFGGIRLRVTALTSAFGFTNIVFDRSPGITNTNNVFLVTRPGKLLTSPPVLTRLTQMFNRIQIVDLRNLEIVWEGRIEEPARESDEPNVWTLNCLGSAVSATDIKRPMFYMDAGIDYWKIDARGIPDTWFEYNITSDGTNKCQLVWKDGSTTGGSDSEPQQLVANGDQQLFRWELPRSMALFLARYSLKIYGWDTMNWTAAAADTDGRLRAGVAVETDGFAETAGLSLKYFNASESVFTGLIGTNFASNIQTVTLTQRAENFDRILTVSTHNIGCSWYTMRMQVQRKDRFGNSLTAAVDYSHGDYVTVPMIVEDVLGRLLYGAWDLYSFNAPYPGQVKWHGSYIDVASAKKITHLIYPDGATAADILNDCMRFQPDAYWAIWESGYGGVTWTDAEADYTLWLYRFEWATWPTSWGYVITEYDELDEQPSGEQMFNFIWLIFRGRQFFSTDTPVDIPMISWGEGIESDDLARMWLVRGNTLRRDDITYEVGGTSGTEEANSTADQYRRDHSRVSNSGTVTVSRPVYLFDAGNNSNVGMARTLDPWAIRPGKLARIKNLFSQAGSLDHSFASTTLMDSFTRSVSNGWGNADTGQVWSNSGGVAGDYSTNGTVGRVSNGSVNVRRFTSIEGFVDFDLRGKIAVPVTAAGASIIAGFVFRYLDANNFYAFELVHDTGGFIDIQFVKRVAGTITNLITASNVFSYAFALVNVRVRCVGDTFQGKIWQDNTNEVAAWNLVTTDTTFTSGQVGTDNALVTGNTNTLPVITSYDDLEVINLQLPLNSDGSLFKVAATEYSTNGNKCKMELDNVANWNLPEQVAK